MVGFRVSGEAVAIIVGSSQGMPVVRPITIGRIIAAVWVVVRGICETFAITADTS